MLSNRSYIRVGVLQVILRNRFYRARPRQVRGFSLSLMALIDY